MSELRMQVAGQEFADFVTVSMTLGLEDLAWRFDVAYVDRRGNALADYPVREGDAATFKIDGELVLTGWVDIIEINEVPGGVNVRMSGRSIVADLVDCSATGKGRWKDADLEKIAKDLCTPLGIDVVVDGVDVGEPFRRAKLRSGETVLSALRRYAEIRGVVLTTNGEGDLVLTRPGLQRIATGIERGVNVLKGQRISDFGNRFSHYIYRSQSAGDDTWNLDEADERIAIAEDEEVRRYRPLVLEAEKGEADLQLRAEWKRNREAGRSRQATYTVQGWAHRDGLWLPGFTTMVKDPRMAIEGELLITQVAFQRGLGPEGTVAQVTLGAKEGWDPYVPPKKPDAPNVKKGKADLQLLALLMVQTNTALNLAGYPSGKAAAQQQKGQKHGKGSGKGFCKEYDK